MIDQDEEAEVIEEALGEIDRARARQAQARGSSEVEAITAVDPKVRTEREFRCNG